MNILALRKLENLMLIFPGLAKLSTLILDIYELPFCLIVQAPPPSNPLNFLQDFTPSVFQQQRNPIVQTNAASNSETRQFVQISGCKSLGQTLEN